MPYWRAFGPEANFASHVERKTLLPAYKVYLMNPHNGHIERLEEFPADDDLDAERLARKYVADYPVELWCGHRKIARFETSKSEMIARLHRIRPEDLDWSHRGRC